MSERVDMMLEALHRVLEEKPFEEQPQIDEVTEAYVVNMVAEVLVSFVEVLIKHGRARQDELGYMECFFINRDFDKLTGETIKRYIKNKWGQR